MGDNMEFAEAIIQAIKDRRSIRRFKPDPVAPEALEAVLEAIRWAPSWGNTQCWEVIVVKEPDQRELLDSTLPKKNSAKGSMLEAPIVLAMAAVKGKSGYYKEQVQTRFGDWMLYDCALASQNACLMAHALGLGTVILGQFDHTAIEEALALPRDYSMVCLIAMGHPAKKSLRTPRREIKEFVHYDKF